MEKSLKIAQIQARFALERAARKAKRDGRDKMSMDEIDTVVAAVRAEKRKKATD